MRFQQQRRIEASPNKLWPVMADVQQAAQCIPGIEAVRPAGQDNWLGTFKVHVGPFSVRMEARVKLLEQDAETRTMRLEVSVDDARIGGGFKGTATLRLADSAGGSILLVDSDFTTSGMATAVGPDMLQKKAAEALDTFAANLGSKASVAG